MTVEKRNRLIAAIAVNVILLIVVLSVVSIYQMVIIAKTSGLKKDIQAKIDYFTTEIKKDEDTLNYYKEGDGLLDKAYEWGFRPAK